MGSGPRETTLESVRADLLKLEFIALHHAGEARRIFKEQGLAKAAHYLKALNYNAEDAAFILLGR